MNIPNVKPKGIIFDVFVGIWLVIMSLVVLFVAGWLLLGGFIVALIGMAASQ